MYKDWASEKVTETAGFRLRWDPDETGPDGFPQSMVVVMTLLQKLFAEKVVLFSVIWL